MIRFPILADLPTTPFSGPEVVRGVESSSSDGDGDGGSPTVENGHTLDTPH